jgi:hypothetical protein
LFNFSSCVMSMWISWFNFPKDNVHVLISLAQVRVYCSMAWYFVVLSTPPYILN